MQINFSDPRLIAKWGTWVRVQVEFYDFLFERGTKGFNKEAVAAVSAGQWHDGGNIYDQAVAGIEREFKSPEQAWEEFCRFTEDS